MNKSYQEVTRMWVDKHPGSSGAENNVEVDMSLDNARADAGQTDRRSATRIYHELSRDE